jgi:hypothetical protein
MPIGYRPVDKKDIEDAISRELVNVSPKLRLIDFTKDTGEWNNGRIVDMDGEGIPCPNAYGDTRPECAFTVGYFSGSALKVTVPPYGSKTVVVGSSPIFRPFTPIVVEAAFYLESGLNAMVNWGIGSTKNIAEEATVFAVRYEGRNNWNLYFRTLLQEFFQQKNWVVFNLTNTTNAEKSMYIGRVMFAEVPEDFGHYEDVFTGYIPVTETSLTTKIDGLVEFPAWMGLKSRYVGVLHTLNVVSDGVNTLTVQTECTSKTSAQVIDTYSYSGATTSPSRFIGYIVDRRLLRGLMIRVMAYMSGGKGYIRRFTNHIYLNQVEPPVYPKYLEGSYTTNGDGLEDSVMLLNYLTTPLAKKYAKVKAVELSVGGTNGYAYLVIDGNTATEKVTSGGTKVIEDLGDAEQIVLKANDPGGGATVLVTYKIYYKEVGALLVR